MLLVNDQIKERLPAKPFDRVPDGRSVPSSTEQPDALDALIPFRAGKIIRKPTNLVAAPGQFRKVRQRDPFRPASLRILRIAPIQHQETHGRDDCSSVDFVHPSEEGD